MCFNYSLLPHSWRQSELTIVCLGASSLILCMHNPQDYFFTVAFKQHKLERSVFDLNDMEVQGKLVFFYSFIYTHAHTLACMSLPGRGLAVI